MNSSNPEALDKEGSISLIWLARLSIIGVLLQKIFSFDYRIFHISISLEEGLKGVHLLPIILFSCLALFNAYRLIQEYFTKSKILVSKRQAKVFSISCGALGLLFFDMIFQDLGPALVMLPSLYFVAKREIEYSK